LGFGFLGSPIRIGLGQLGLEWVSIAVWTIGLGVKINWAQAQFLFFSSSFWPKPISSWLTFQPSFSVFLLSSFVFLLSFPVFACALLSSLFFFSALIPRLLLLPVLSYLFSSFLFIFFHSLQEREQESGG
jgi:hypothetical protein